MSNYPVKSRRNAVRPATSKTVEVLPSDSASNAFVSFRYSYSEISIGGGKAHVRSTRAQFENGKLTSEAFEGELNPTVYEQLAAQAQRYFTAQVALFLRPLALFLPFTKQPPGRD
jgi:hypothetical protein